MAHPDLVYAAEIRPVIDSVYRALRAAGGPRCGAVVARRGVDRAAIGIIYDIYFAMLERPLTTEQLRAVERYVTPDDIEISLAQTVGAGLATRDRDGTVELTGDGREFALDLQVAIAEEAEAVWGPSAGTIRYLNGLLSRLLAAGRAGGGAAFTAVSPPYEPAGASAVLLFCNRLGALRHHRADAHGAAWAAQRLTAAEMVALDDDGLRALIEHDTNQRDAPIYTVLDDGERDAFRSGLASLTG